MTLFCQREEQTYLISSYTNLEEIQADKRKAISLIDIFCTIKGRKEYGNSELVKVENHQINYELLIKLLKRTIESDIVLTEEEQRILEPFAEQLGGLEQ